MTSSEILDKKFERANGGYRSEKVDEFLASVALEINSRDEKLKKLADRIIQYENEKQDFDSNVKALAMAQITNQKIEDKIKADAHKEAEKLIEAAKREAANIISSAEKVLEKAKKDSDSLHQEIRVKCEERINLSKQKVEEQKSEYDRILNETETFKRKILEEYKLHIISVNALPEKVLREKLAESASDNPTPPTPKETDVSNNTDVSNKKDAAYKTNEIVTNADEIKV
ncbi:MAG: DivIVA domain-containing protein [Ruminococcus sp.]|jgi:DivIVA domain-containing protein|nr:DivIVA domain-containing protein [Ruminococcus sp.]